MPSCGRSPSAASRRRSCDASWPGDAERRRLVTEAEEPQGRAQPRLRGHRPGPAPRRGRPGRDGADARGRRAHQGAGRARSGGRRGHGRAAAPDPEPAAPDGAPRLHRRRQRRGAPLGLAARVRLRPEAPRGDRRGPRPPRLRAREQARQGAVRGPVGRPGAPRARARPVHARPAHARARVHRGLGAAPRERGHDDAASASCRSSRSSSSRPSSRTTTARSTSSRPPRCR